MLGVGLEGPVIPSEELLGGLGKCNICLYVYMSPSRGG